MQTKRELGEDVRQVTCAWDMSCGLAMLSVCLAGVPCRCSRCCACQSDLSSFQDAAFPVFVLFF